MFFIYTSAIGFVLHAAVFQMRTNGNINFLFSEILIPLWQQSLKKNFWDKGQGHKVIDLGVI